MVNKFFVIGVLCVLIFLVTYKIREGFLNQTNKKIAFCFLIYDKINHEDLWYKFFKNIDKSKYNIYIHYKNNTQLKHFEKHKVTEIVDTKWCGDSLVKAQNILLKEAIKDNENQHFIFVSNSCIPVKTFNHIYNKLNENFSYFNMAIPFTDKFNDMKAYKASQWCILNRKHTKQLLENKEKLNDIFNPFKQKFIGGCPDEYAYITLLYYLKLDKELITTNNISADATTFTAWNDMSNFKDFKKSNKKGEPNNYSNICEEELDYILNSKSFFARKFDKNCKGLNKVYDILN